MIAFQCLRHHLACCQPRHLDTLVNKLQFFPFLPLALYFKKRKRDIRQDKLVSTTTGVKNKFHTQLQMSCLIFCVWMWARDHAYQKKLRTGVNCYKILDDPANHVASWKARKESTVKRKRETGVSTLMLKMWKSI